MEKDKDKAEIIKQKKMKKRKHEVGKVVGDSSSASFSFKPTFDPS